MSISSGLGLVVVDEQHRFGVEQRDALRQKGYHPHMLVMTATPIPRTLALTLYGDLDVSVIDQLPPGRQKIITRWRTGSRRDEAYDLIAREVADGHQAFIICPLIEESESLAVKAVTVEFERLGREVFPHLRLGLLHGGMKAAEKDATMRKFPRRRTGYPGCYLGDRGRYRHSQRDGDGNRGRGPLWSFATTSVPWARRTR